MLKYCRLVSWLIPLSMIMGFLNGAVYECRIQAHNVETGAPVAEMTMRPSEDSYWMGVQVLDVVNNGNGDFTVWIDSPIQEAEFVVTHTEGCAVDLSLNFFDQCGGGTPPVALAAPSCRGKTRVYEIEVEDGKDGTVKDTLAELMADLDPEFRACYDLCHGRKKCVPTDVSSSEFNSFYGKLEKLEDGKWKYTSGNNIFDGNNLYNTRWTCECL